MTQFRSKKDGTHYPLNSGIPVYPSKKWTEERRQAIITDINNCRRHLVTFKNDKTMREQTEKLLMDNMLKLAFIDMNDAESIDSVYYYLDQNFVLEHQFHHEMVGTKKIWEYPAVTENNIGRSPFGTYFCTIYHDELTDENVFVGGKMGNTSTYIIKGVK